MKNLFKKNLNFVTATNIVENSVQSIFATSLLQHLFVVLFGDYIDASGKSSLKMNFKAHISSRKIRLQNYISKNFPKIEYFYYWKLNERNIWVEIYSWLLKKNKVVLQETKKVWCFTQKSKQEEAERKLKFYNQI